MNPCNTQGGNPTRPLVEHKNSVIVAVQADGDGWAGTRVFRTLTRATRALRPLTSEALEQSDWEVWRCENGEVWWIAKEEVE